MGNPAERPFSILIVDDEIDNRNLLESRLQKLPHANLAVDTARNGDEALKKLAGSEFDLVFLDYHLPPTDGLDILEKIRQHHPQAAVVMTTAAGSEQVAVAAMKKGAMDYLTTGDLAVTDLGRLLRRVDEIRSLVNQNMELRQVNQMKNEFIANVSHELRTPLSVVIGYAGTLRGGSLGPIQDAQRKALTAIIRNAEGLMGTLNNILRIHEGLKPMLLKPVDLKALVEAALDRAGESAQRKNLTVKAALAAKPVWTLAEPEKLSEVVDHLLSNAVKFSPPGGALRVELSSSRGKARLLIADQGPGVPPEVLPHVFERFFAANQGPTREYPGLGLGLALSKEFVDHLGGRIWLESQGAGSGTIVYLEISTCAPDAAAAIIDDAGTLRKKHVLIVEDNPDLIDLLMLFLAGISRSLSLATARSGFEALEKIKDGTPDLIILDIMMPKMNGFEVLSRLRRLPDADRTPVLVLTGYSDLAQRARDAGAREVLLKPFEKDVFIKHVLRLLQETGARH